MDIRTAYTIIGGQMKSIKKLDKFRFTHKGFEYEIRYYGGIALIVDLYRREIGKRNFKYFKGTACYKCLGSQEALQKLEALLP